MTSPPKKPLIAVPITRETQFYRDKDGNLCIKLPPKTLN